MATMIISRLTAQHTEDFADTVRELLTFVAINASL
jgi:hypothetical protein